VITVTVVLASQRSNPVPVALGPIEIASVLCASQLQGAQSVLGEEVDMSEDENSE
jgi:hypothetical protein